ncbi:MAG TPA: AMP-binding protein, partial [Burkholderiaceae bacterium]|nr:AMP-binding protein [Burkholderiaceae bacterium]
MSQMPAGIIEGVPLAAPIPSVTVPQFLRQRARECAEQTALIEAASGRSYSYGTLDQLIGRFAAGLAARGFAPGDTLVTFLPNLPEWPIAALGAMCAGGIVSGANPTGTVPELARQLRDARARFIVTIPLFLDTVREALAQVGGGTLILLG